MPCPVFVVEEDVRILDFNTAAAQVLERKPQDVRHQRAGHALHCLHSQETPEGCGHAPACATCPIRGAVNMALRGEHPPRQKVRLIQARPDGSEESFFLITVAPLQVDQVALALVILEDIQEITLLREMLPICSHCKQVRTDENYWQSVENYLANHHEIDCTHSLCPECAQQLFPDYAEKLADPEHRPEN